MDITAEFLLNLFFQLALAYC